MGRLLRPRTVEHIVGHTRPASRRYKKIIACQSIAREILYTPTLLEAGWASCHFYAVFKGKGQEIVVFIIIGGFRDQSVEAIAVRIKARGRGRSASVDTRRAVRPAWRENRTLVSNIAVLIGQLF